MKNKDNGIVLFNGEHKSPLWLKPYKITDGKVVSGEVINGAWSFTKKYLQEPNYYIIVPEEVIGDYNDVIEWAQRYMREIREKEKVQSVDLSTRLCSFSSCQIQIS